MKRYTFILFATLLSFGCIGQEKDTADEIESKEETAVTEPPKGNWEVSKEFDESGNLIRYDSIYSWSSGDDLDKLASLNRDSVLQSMQSKFYRNFSSFENEGFEDFFEEDSLFTKRFFNNDFFESDFGKDFMDVDKMHERMEAMQKNFLERYESMIFSEKDKDSIN